MVAEPGYYKVVYNKSERMCVRIAITFLVTCLLVTTILPETYSQNVNLKSKPLNVGPQPNPTYLTPRSCETDPCPWDGAASASGSESTSKSMSPMKILLIIVGFIAAIPAYLGIKQLCNSCSISFCNGWFSTNNNAPAGPPRVVVPPPPEDHRMNNNSRAGLVELVVHPTIQILDDNAPVDSPPVEPQDIRIGGNSNNSTAGEVGPVKRRVFKIPEPVYEDNASVESPSDQELKDYSLSQPIDEIKPHME